MDRGRLLVKRGAWNERVASLPVLVEELSAESSLHPDRWCWRVGVEALCLSLLEKVVFISLENRGPGSGERDDLLGEQEALSPGSGDRETLVLAGLRPLGE